MKEDAAYLSRMNCLILGRFSSVGAQGSVAGKEGGRVRLGQEQGLSSGSRTPLLLQGGRPTSLVSGTVLGSTGGSRTPLDSLAASWLGLERGVWWREGKSWLTSPIAFMADMGR